MRIYQLAKTLNVESKDLLDYCKELGYDIKNQLSSLDPDQTDALIQRVKQGNKVAAPAGPVAPVIPTNLSTKLQTIRAKPAAARPAAPETPADATPPTPAAPPAAAVIPPTTPAAPRATTPPTTRPPTPAAPPS